MGDGFRDSFAANIDDEFGSIYDSNSDVNNMVAPRSRRKNKKSRAVGRKARRRKSIKHGKRNRSRNRSRSRSRSTSGHRSKRKGMSKEFLRQLRKKHGLGEFKRR